MATKQVGKPLDVLKEAGIPTCQPEDAEEVMTLASTEADEEAIKDYLSKFCKPVHADSDTLKCRCCEGLLHVTWGIRHGHGHCITCGYPARIYHYPDWIGIGDGGAITQVLQWHPSELEDVSS